MASLSVLHILRTIKEHGILSRTDLQQITRLSWGTITNTTRELLDRNLIREEGTLQTKSGRKPMRLAVNPEGHCLIGVEITGGSLVLVRCIAANLSGDVLDYREAACPAEEPPQSILERAAEMVRETLHQPSIYQRMCLGVGVALSGAVDVKRGVLRFSPRMPAWFNVPVREYMQLKVSSPVMLEVDTNCLALAQRWFGEASAAEEALCINLGETVGMGILHEGEIFRGAQDLAGGFGHTTLSPDGPTCACGDRGCVQAYCAVPAVLAAAREDAAVSPTLRAKGSALALSDLVAAAPTDAAVRGIFARMGRQLGVGLANLIDLFNPNIVVLCGPLTTASEHFLPAVTEQVDLHASKQSQRRLALSTLGDREVALGACGMVLQNVFDQDQSEGDIATLKRA